MWLKLNRVARFELNRLVVFTGFFSLCIFLFCYSAVDGEKCEANLDITTDQILPLNDTDSMTQYQSIGPDTHLYSHLLLELSYVHDHYVRLGSYCKSEMSVYIDFETAFGDEKQHKLRNEDDLLEQKVGWKLDSVRNTLTIIGITVLFILTSSKPVTLTFVVLSCTFGVAGEIGVPLGCHSERKDLVGNILCTCPTPEGDVVRQHIRFEGQSKWIPFYKNWQLPNSYAVELIPPNHSHKIVFLPLTTGWRIQDHVVDTTLIVERQGSTLVMEDTTLNRRKHHSRARSEPVYPHNHHGYWFEVITSDYDDHWDIMIRIIQGANFEPPKGRISVPNGIEYNFGFKSTGTHLISAFGDLESPTVTIKKSTLPQGRFLKYLIDYGASHFRPVAHDTIHESLYQSGNEIRQLTLEVAFGFLASNDNNDREWMYNFINCETTFKTYKKVLGLAVNLRNVGSGVRENRLTAIFDFMLRDLNESYLRNLAFDRPIEVAIQAYMRRKDIQNFGSIRRR